MAPLDDTTRYASATATLKRISYRFFLGQNGNSVVDLYFDPQTHQLVPPDDASRPDWTRLDCNRCPNCTLPADSTHCPAAVGIAQFLPQFQASVSHQRTVVEVETAQRTIVAKTTLQNALASLIGLVCATSGCPRTQFLRPMARFHLPFADETETMFRSFSTWLLVSLLQQRKSGQTASLDLNGLKEHYSQVSVVNTHLAQRLRQTATRDAALNAIIILELFAQIAPDNIDGDFEDLSDLLLCLG